MQILEILTLAASGAALLTAALSARSVCKMPVGGRMAEIGEIIRKGARAFLRRQYRTVFVFISLVFLLFLLHPSFGWRKALAYLCGSFSSLAAGYFGMQVAVRANSRTANSALSGLEGALKTAFRGGLVMGMLVVGLGMLGLLGFWLWLGDPSFILPFCFGASSVAVFARVGGGIYTKTADVGADLVGKVEVGIPEDDPRNPAVIADNVGDNVGDVAGMGSDLFESFAASIVATMVMGTMLGTNYLILPLGVAAVGTLASILASLMVRVRKGKDPSYVLNLASLASMAITAVGSFLISGRLFGSEGLRVFAPVALGLVTGVTVGLVSDYFTNRLHAPAKSVARSASSGAAIDILSGYSVGLLSTVLPILVISLSLVGSFWIAKGISSPAQEAVRGMYGICLAGVGMLSVTGMVVSADAYGPIADNAGGIIEQAGEEEKREVTDALDSVGNTTKAISKGFAIGSAALTSVALFFSYSRAAKLSTLDLLSPDVAAGVLIGGSVIALFSALVIQAVGRNAFRMVEEVRRQFREIPGLMKGKAKPDYERCVDLATRGALKELLLPVLLVLLSPILVGFLLGARALGGLQVGSIAVGLVFALQMANSGAVWDNAKKFIELGNLGGKGTPTHQAAVVGDTVGDPLKDAAGPSLNIAIKLMSIVALLMATAGMI